MATENFTPLKGHCTCKTITYEVLAPFLCTNCCHCTWCQRETGAAFAINSIIETSNFRFTSETKPILSDLPTASGDGQKAARCPNCSVILCTDYGDDFTWTTFVKVGTLDDESKNIVKPDVHIFTSTKMEWVDLTSEKKRGIPILEASYKAAQVWKKDALERFDVLKQKMKKAEAEKEESKSTGDR
ncbi:Mss4-like protein [Talaromyces proteolyticus]|uniref:Mss4-like protein n=1 Tax=Talaromyces proteolyticus TaxID=1131652 RepID=A0AAD4KWY0_9EURO|nr:Mss4-like protein [Talaromyces proteolyticus]KAH8703045.1 Mss4-like protein [Talaromyces proteolyticus]